MIRNKRLRQDPPEPTDGTRIYVGRYYPRGLREGSLWHERRHDLGPSRALHAAIKRGDVDWATYRARYRAELDRPEARKAIEELASRSRAGETFTLLCDHPRSLPDEACHRFLLAQRIQEAERGLDVARAK